MPMTWPTVWAFTAIGLTVASPGVAQNTGVPGADPVGTLVPYLPGASYPHTLGPARRGPMGRPRGFGRMYIEMDILPSCTLVADQGPRTSVHCSNPLPYYSLLNSDGEGGYADTLAFASGAVARADGPPIPVHVLRFTVDY